MKVEDAKSDDFVEPGFLRSELLEILQQSGMADLAEAAHRTTQCRVIEFQGKRFKVRSYRDAEAAQRRLELVAEAKDGLFIDCYGRVDRYLVLEYREGTIGYSSEELSSLLGKFLGVLERTSLPFSPNDEFGAWCEVLEQANIFRPRTLRSIRDHYASLRPENICWSLQYFDLMPRNFIVTEKGELVSIDEKHLRVGPRGISLVKPMWQMRKENFRRVKEEHHAHSGFTEFDDPDYRRFLVFYYCLYSLASSGKVSASVYRKLSSFHLMRQKVLRRVGLPISEHLKEVIPWWVRYQLYGVESFLLSCARTLLHRTPAAKRIYFYFRSNILLKDRHDSAEKGLPNRLSR